MSQHYGPPPQWFFAEPPRRRRRTREPYYDAPPPCPDPIEQITKWQKHLDELKKSLKEEKKEEPKKPPNSWEKLQIFAQQLGGMILIGGPAGYVALKLSQIAMDNLFK